MFIFYFRQINCSFYSGTAADFNQGRVMIGSNIECNPDPNVAAFFTNNNLSSYRRFRAILPRSRAL
jgi:hypothetical protein